MLFFKYLRLIYRMFFGKQKEIKNRNLRGKGWSKKRKENTYLLTSGRLNHYSYSRVKDVYNQVKLEHHCVTSRYTRLKHVVDFDYVVFIDQSIPFHRDAARKGFNYSNRSDEYFFSVNTFLSRIEGYLNKKVIIAIHPRAIDNYENYYPNFECYRFVTEELIEHSDLVLTHFSTCIYSAVYARKPILIFTNALLEFHHDRGMVYTFAKLLNLNVIDADSEIKFSMIPNSFSEAHYLEFQENYIKQVDSVFRPSVDVLIDKFNLNKAVK